MVWCAALALVAVGPIDYPAQPSLIVLTVVGAGVLLFLVAYRAGGVLFERRFARQGQMHAPSSMMLNRIVIASSLIGIAGIGFIALDRTVLSGVSNGGYAEMLRCAPGLVDAVAIKRTPLLYLGYIMFSFGFVSVVVFLLRGEAIKGWAAALAQLSVVSPVGYALLYSGRMPILFVLVLIIVTILVRISEGRKPLPPGHHLLLKTIVAIGLFAIYSSSIWSSRQNFCAQVSPLIRELQAKQKERDAAQPQLEAAPKADEAPVRPSTEAGSSTTQPKSAEVMTATDFSKRMAEATAAPAPSPEVSSADAVLAIRLEAWNVKPRGYVTSALESSHLSARAAMIGLSTYFYLTHGVRTIDIAWHARDKFSRQWGVYEVGVLSPILRVFAPENQHVATMEAEQRSAGTYGFFPTVWLAAFIDFGIAGAVIYILVWGCVAGWSAAGARRSSLMTPQLLLVFVLASILLSPVQGPLGVANSALVLGSMLVVGLAVDVWTGTAKQGDQEKDQ
ncbi:hypothetical protein UP09_28650 [Bradyrhizobium sp. LTSP885]|nr:hypothetical protein UP09_28650 [Bradyrhizobium sp. LTSP885]